MIELLHVMVVVYATVILFVLFLWYVLADLAGFIPVSLSEIVLMDFIYGGVLIQKCWQEVREI